MGGVLADANLMPPSDHFARSLAECVCVKWCDFFSTINKAMSSSNPAFCFGGEIVRMMARMITSWKQQFHSSAIRIATELGDMGLFSGNFSGVISGSGLLQTRTTDLGSSFLRFIFEPE